MIIEILRNILSWKPYTNTNISLLFEERIELVSMSLIFKSEFTLLDNYFNVGLDKIYFPRM